MLVLDRLEGELAYVAEGEAVRAVPRALLDPAAREGDVLLLRAGRYVPDAQATADRRSAMRAKLRRLVRRG